jgi:iron complex transport system ATP-binding protein
MVGDVFELRNVSVVRDGKRILDSINLELHENENAAIIGLNGSGKTTLLKLLRGDVLPYYDTENPPVMRLFGESSWNLFELRNKMGVVSMDLQNQFVASTRVYEVIASGYFGSLDVFRNMSVSEEMVKKTYEMASLMGIEDLLERSLDGLSLGEMRRTLIARALITDPKLLVLDEPMTGLDIVMNSKFRRMFDILIERGVNIIMITHDLSDIPICINRVVMLKDGKKFADGDKKNLLNSETVSEVYGEDIKVECTNGIYRMHMI